MDMPMNCALYAYAGRPTGFGLVAGIVGFIMIGGISAGMVLGRRGTGVEEESAFMETENRYVPPPRKE